MVDHQSDGASVTVDSEADGPHNPSVKTDNEKNAAFTQGDWYVIEKKQPVGYAHYEIAWSEHGELVCDIVYEKADAHLMAASKKMYEALRAMMSERFNGPDSCTIWAQAKAALSKAEAR